VEKFTDNQLHNFLNAKPGHRSLHNIYQVRVKPLNYFTPDELEFLVKKSWEISKQLVRERRRRRRTDQNKRFYAETELLLALERALEKTEGRRTGAGHWETCVRKSDCKGKLVCSPVLKKCITNREYETIGTRRTNLSVQTESRDMRRALEHSRCVHRDPSCHGESDLFSMENIQRDPSGDEISVEDVVRVDKKCYDIAPLRQWLNQNPTLPHNRQSFSSSDLNTCIQRNVR